MSKAIEVNLEKEGIWINGIFAPQLSKEFLKQAIGEPKVIKGESDSLVWDDHGIAAFTYDDRESIHSLYLVYPSLQVLGYSCFPREDFSGTFLIEKKPFMEKVPRKKIEDADPYIRNIKFGNWKIRAESSEDEITEFCIYKNEDVEQSLVVELNDRGISINGIEVNFPTSRLELQEILGVPTHLYYENYDWRIIWDNYGVYTSGNLDFIYHLSFLVNPESRVEHLPQNLFTGSVLINGLPIEVNNEKAIKINKYQIHKARYYGEQSNEIYSYILMENHDYSEEVNKDKYKLSRSSKETIQFQNFNFKLLIIEELMYNKELLKPKFDIYEFAKLYDKREISIEEEGYDPIPEAIEWFETLPIKASLAKHVKELNLDGGSDVYCQIWPFGDGECDYFDVKNLDIEDLKQFPNLKEIDGTVNMFDEESTKLLESLGIEIIID